MSRTTVIAAAVGAALLAGAGALLVLPDTGPDLEEVASKPKARKKAKAERRAGKAKGPEVAAAPKAKSPDRLARRRVEARRRLALSRPEGKAHIEQIRELRTLEGDERVEKREGMRADKLASNEERVRKAGEKMGWDEDTHAEVLEVVTVAHDDITAVMAQVDRGELTWEEARPAMHEAREEQAMALREVLGDAGYRDFTEAMAPNVSARSRLGPGMRGGPLRGPVARP
jgi:hypothetical protein